CENADENGFIMIKISELEEKLNQSKPTIIATFKFLEEKKLFKRLKNGFYQLKI
ncbi:ArsR family transcriptional regulator, partial [Campylobacter jejuni]|nr:ArsR family transcriptional regulator [Campylobacter jejuni]